MKMDALPVKKKKLPQRGKAKQESRTDSFLRRQSECRAHRSRPHSNPHPAEDKTWLETHIWHSKRMIMENMWGYRLVRRGVAFPF